MACVTPTTIAWLNTLGGWEFFTFCTRKDYGYNVQNVSQIERDPFINWESEFINGETIIEDLEISANRTYQIVSPQLSEDQLQAMARLRFSRKVQDVTNAASPVTVIVDKGSFQFFQDRQKRRTISFNLTYPPIYIQNA